MSLRDQILAALAGKDFQTLETQLAHRPGFRELMPEIITPERVRWDLNILGGIFLKKYWPDLLENLAAIPGFSLPGVQLEGWMRHRSVDVLAHFAPQPNQLPLLVTAAAAAGNIPALNKLCCDHGASLTPEDWGQLDNATTLLA